MSRKIESWTHLVIDEARDFAASLTLKTEREIVISTCSMIDCLLADLIATTLRDDKAEVEKFLGLNADGQAPLGSFGSRIQAAYLLRLIDGIDLKFCRILKFIRNRFAHNVAVSFSDSDIVQRIREMAKIAYDTGPREIKPDREYLSKEKFSELLIEFNYSRDACVGYFIGAAALLIKQLNDAYAARAKVTDSSIAPTD